ncbi:allantoinase [Meiothermus taiwanensis]|jgi:allantoinase|uniref:Allantoinase n=2 Tax=Meiothermus taiwanensis TaxID=172827 RepID=A0A399DQS2_9DEIN|nr:allantoinase [Meiothermus taiwanensis]AWR86825.1 allantoinase [Meiothermus taiwanensis WR-220]KIQ54155.1 allantoinase [Meiothermus taiwanensis]KZK16987.1 allantoinase [Meiothermus taiwanensis]RIH74684.1 Allantoinase [Meiothermus taiwanensis]
MLDLIVRGGKLVTPEGVRQADLAVAEGRIVQIAPEITEPARQEIRAEGLHVFPGLIDVHVHFNEPGRAHWEGIASGSAALAAGGGTAFFDMPLNSLPCTLDAPSFDQKLAAMRASSYTDFALWGGLTPGNLEHLPELAERGVIGFKAFMSNSGLPEFPPCDDGSLYEGMRIAARLGLPVAVHAESEALTAHFTQQKRRQGQTTWRDYLASRPVFTELEAIQRALLLAQETGCKLHIVHISSGAGVALAAEARARGVDVSLETCPHYLAFTEEDLERLGAVGKCAPPLRSREQQTLLWNQVLQGQVDIVASDHSPSPPEMKQGQDFFAMWGGIAGVQSTLAVLLTEGWQQRGLALERLAALLSANPARRFGLVGKGLLAEGYEADFALVDLQQTHTLKPQNLRYRHPISPYLGRSFVGVVRETWLRGQRVYALGKIEKPSEVRLLKGTIPFETAP